MNVWLAVKVLSHALGRQKWLYVLLLSIALASGVSLMLIEKGIRKGSAQVANRFDLIIAAPGSKIDAVLNLLYVQSEPLATMLFVDWHPVLRDERVAWVSPIVKGDFINGMPVIGVTPSLVHAIYGVDISFSAMNSALVGADSGFSEGEALVTQHGLFVLDDDEDHAHGDQALTVQARLPRSQTPWDAVILVPIEQVWRTHSLSWSVGDEKPSTLDWDADHQKHSAYELLSTSDWAALTHAPNVLALVVKPKRLSDAFALRSAYNGHRSMAFFPAEVLVRLHALLGNVSDFLTLLTLVSEALVVISVVVGLTTWMQLLTPTFTLLRAMGAPARYVLFSVWSAMALLMLTACVVGLLLGVAIAFPVSQLVSGQLHIPVPITLSGQETKFTVGLFLISLIATLWPAWVSYRKPLSSAIRRL